MDERGEVEFRIVESYELRKWVGDLRALEGLIEYPLDDDAFTIDHGPEYHPFFSGMGLARFLLVLHEGRAVGTLAGVWRDVEVEGGVVPSLYFGDYKLAREWRGGAVARGMAWHALKEWWKRPDLGGWRMLFGAAMRGDGGDVTRSIRGAHAGRLLEPAAVLRLFFVEPEVLASADLGPEPRWPGSWSNLTPGESREVVRTDGTKDLRLVRGEGRWPLAHLPLAPQECEGRWGEYLVRAGKRLVDEGGMSVACFGVDQRATRHLAWLERGGIVSGATCTIHAFHIPERGEPHISEVDYVHMSTATI